MNEPPSDQVVAVRPLPAPAARGMWPCALCEGLFPVRNSWRVTFRSTRRTIACPRCAQQLVATRSDGDDPHLS